MMTNPSCLTILLRRHTCPAVTGFRPPLHANHLNLAARKFLFVLDRFARRQMIFASPITAPQTADEIALSNLIACLQKDDLAQAKMRALWLIKNAGANAFLEAALQLAALLELHSIELTAPNCAQAPRANAPLQPLHLVARQKVRQA